MPRLFAFRGRDILVVEGPDGSVELPRDGIGAAVELDPGWRVAGLPGTAPDEGSYDLPDGWEPPAGARLLGLRALFGHVDPETARTAGTVLHRLEWIRSHRFCSRCGTPTRRSTRHDAFECGACRQLHFPRIAPAVIVLVQRPGEMLLARSPHFAEGVYSTLAGFVEPGESLEETVHREIREEVGVEVGDLRYFGSQPWPFPHSLMVGFVAEWRGGEIRLEDDEIEDARWFAPDRMPPALPFGHSISRRLIEDFLARAGGGAGGGETGR